MHLASSTPLRPSLGVALLALAALGLAACDSKAPAAVGPGTSDAGDVQCSGAALAGCPCSGDVSPIECFLPPRPGSAAGTLECAVGSRTCRDGQWTTCQGISNFTIDAPKSLGEPTRCNACNPQCVTQTSTPDGDDLTPDNCDGVFYDPALPGLTVQTTPPASDILEDSDGDGYPDVIDDCPGQPTFREPCGDPSVEAQGFAFVLPHGATDAADYPELQLQLETVDYYVLMDASGTMTPMMNQLRTDLTTGNFLGGTPPAGCNATSHPGVLGAIRCRLPNVAVGVGMVREYPRAGATNGDNTVPYYHLLDPTTNFGLAQTMVNSLSVNDTHSDYPEATSQALYSMASGNGLGPWKPSRASCEDGGFGYPCFRPGTIPVILVITDAPMQGGPNPFYGYSNNQYGTPTNNNRVPPSALNLPPVITEDVDGFTIQERMNQGAAAVFDLGDITNRSVTVSGTTFGSPLTHNIANCNGTGPRAPLFRFSLTQTTIITFDTNGSEFDTVMGLLNQNQVLYTPHSTFCNDDRANADALLDPEGNRTYPRASRLRVQFPPGTYHMVIDGKGTGVTGRGAFQFRVHNETAGDASLRTSSDTPRSWAQTVSALNAIGAKTIGIAVCNGASGVTGSQCGDAQTHLRALGNATGSVSSTTGQPFVYLGNANGSGLSSQVVDATLELANQLTLDVSLRCFDNPSTPENECALFEVRGVPPGNTCPATCTGGYSGNTCRACAPGTNLNFELRIQNVGVEPTDEPQVFEFDVALVADGINELSRLPVRVVVPPYFPPMPADGWFEMTYESTDHCAPPDQRPAWGPLHHDMTTPPGTRVDIRLRTANTLADLASAPFVTVPSTSSAPAPNPLHLGQALINGGQSDNQLYLAVRFHLYSDETGEFAPVLRTFDTVYDCVDFE